MERKYQVVGKAKCIECGEIAIGQICPRCGMCPECCWCHDDYDADELGLDPEEGYD